MVIVEVTANCPWKFAVKLVSTKFLVGKIYVQRQHESNKLKTKSIKPKLLERLNMNQF